MDTKEYAYVFDYSTGSIYEAEINDITTNMETDEFLDYYNLNIDSCYVMFTQRKLEIEKLTKE